MGSPMIAATRRVLGADVVIEIRAIDETNTRVRPERIARAISRRRAGAAWSGWSACSRTSSRMPSISRGGSARAGVQVAIGGFHVSGCLAMLPEMPADLQEAQALGISLFAGEAEGRLDRVLRDACAGR